MHAGFQLNLTPPPKNKLKIMTKLTCIKVQEYTYTIVFYYIFIA